MVKTNLERTDQCNVNINSNLTLVTQKGERKSIESGKWFIASTEPFYVGVILPPEPGFWAVIAASKNLSADLDGETLRFKVDQRIEVGSNSIFFLRGIKDSD